MPNKDTASKFSDEEMEQIRRHGAAQMGDPSFSEEVEKELRKREASAAKMMAAQTGGATEGLGPTQIEGQQVQQAGALQQQAATQGQMQAAQAQSKMVPQAPSPAQVGAPQAPGGGSGEPPPGAPGATVQATQPPPQEGQDQG
jgi:hypothetical protein